MSIEKQNEFERNEMSEILAQNFRCNDERYDASDFEWSAFQLQMASFHKQSEGEWGFDGMSWTCSECGEYAPIDKYRMTIKSKFCPNCGAKMKGADNEQREAD